jgi:transcriptional regulator with XRE-family HTH domain
MARMTNQQKKEWAKLLYTKEQMLQKEIAEKVGVTPKTVSKWVTTEMWDKLRISLSVTREEQLSHLYSHLSEINASIASREDGERFPNAKEADTITKLSSSIDKLERESGVGEVVSAFSQFVRWLRERNLEEAQRIAPLLDDFVKYKLR